MTVGTLINNIKNSADHFPNSMILKSSDNSGCVYKWLVRGKELATRKEIFIALDPEESELDLLEKTIIEYTEVYPAN